MNQNQSVTWIPLTSFFFAVHPTIKINIQDSEAAAAGKIEQRRENYPPITYA